MNQNSCLDGPPSRVLLATDLSARCDRAFDRAAQLAGEWRVELVVLNVLESPQAPDLILAWAAGESEESSRRLAQQQLQRDLAGLDIQASLRIARGEPAGAIREAASAIGCGLVITGMARNELFGRFLLGSTVECLARTISQPLLVVRDRVRGAYGRIVVATDFSASSRHALHAAARFFPGRDLILYHAHAAPSANITGESQHHPVSQEIEDECAEFLAASDLSAEARSRLQVVIEPGVLETTLASYIRAHNVELVAMGTHGRSGLMNVLLGNTAARLLDWLPCDTMIVREPRAAN